MKFASVIAALVVALSVNAAFAGDGHVSKGTLSKMGFGGMRVMSDAQGMQTRGMGATAVAGVGNAVVNVIPGFQIVVATGVDQYSASSNTDFAFSSGGRLSFSRAETSLFGGAHITASTGGSAMAFAK
jgi:hypothetical protein